MYKKETYLELLPIRHTVWGLAGSDTRCGDWLGPTHGAGTGWIRHCLSYPACPHSVWQTQPVPAPCVGPRQSPHRVLDPASPRTAC